MKKGDIFYNAEHGCYDFVYNCDYTVNDIIYMSAICLNENHEFDTIISGSIYYTFITDIFS